MSINQLKDDGAVIGYKPKLKYIKSRNLNTATVRNQSSVADNVKENYSNTVNNFENSLPSSALNNIDYVTQNMKLLIDNLATSFDNGNWNQYGEISSLLSALESDNKEYIDKFISYHKENIDGSIIPELIGEIYDTKKRLETLSVLLKELYYGDKSLSTEQTKEIDNAYLKKIKAYESNNEAEKINYLAIYYDSMLNRSVNIYAFSANRQAIDLSDIPTLAENPNTNFSKEELIKKLHNDINKEIDIRKEAYNNQQSIEIMEKTIYNYYNKRSEYLDLYDLFENSNESIFIGRKVQDFKSEVNNSIININRVFTGNKYYLSELVKLEQEKLILKNIYSNISYNSEN
jgi:hypothetical protein